MLRWKSVGLLPSREEERPTDDVSSYLQNLGTKEIYTPNKQNKKTIMKIRIEMNKIENRK